MQQQLEHRHGASWHLQQGPLPPPLSKPRPQAGFSPKTIERSASLVFSDHFKLASRAKLYVCVTCNPLCLCVCGCAVGGAPAGEGHPEAQHLRGLAQLLGSREPRSGDEVRFSFSILTITGTQT